MMNTLAIIKIGLYLQGASMMRNIIRLNKYTLLEREKEEAYGLQ